MKIKVRISVLDAETEIEIKKEGDSFKLIVLASASPYHKEKGTAWHGAIADGQAVKEIDSLITGAYRNPSKTEQITILDGISIHVNYQNETETLDFKFKDYNLDSNEDQLLKKLFKLCNQTCGDEKLRKNLLLFESFGKK